jgi:protein-L-isoaspartate O-methyltransferase
MAEVDMTNPVSTLSDVEDALSRQIIQIAEHLNQPQTENRNSSIDGLWPAIAQLYGPYQAGLAAMNGADKTNDRLRHGAFRASLWPSMKTLLDRQRDPINAPLMTKPKLQVVDRKSDLTSYLTNTMHYLANPIAVHKEFAQSDQFPDIPLSGAYFVNLLQAAYRISLAQSGKRPLRFLDVGCGGGTKLMIAAHFFEHVDGLEYNAAFAENARRALATVQAQSCQVIEGNALSFENYADYDIIYFYRPISDQVLLARMQDTILSQAKSGAIIIAPMSAPIAVDQAAPATWNIYLSKTTVDTATKLADIAVQKGPDWGLDNQQNDQSLGFWLPIIKASRNNGFCLPR